ncbi:MAG TPA: hypothetical protein VKQ07_06620, partial [Jatrophihabitantaceae bacterium]|nr:hypothetical protein [Jatrophihabitantaceae bacterium]
MSAETTAALQKLAHTLGVAPDALATMSAMPADDVRLLRAQIAEALFQADRPRFARIAALSQAIPVALAAKITQHAFPPLLAARTAELVDPQRASELVSRLPDDYLADVAAAMDASRAPEVIARIPAERVARVAAELARRHEWVVIGGFVAQVSQPALAASIAEFDGEQLLRIAFVLDEKSRMDEIGELLTEAQLDGLLTAAVEHDLTLELGDMVEHLDAPHRARLADRTAALASPLRD